MDGSAVVLGIPRGGVVVAAEVARELGAPLDVVVVRKIGAPGNPEFAVGAVDEDGRVLGGSSQYATEEYVAAAAERLREEIARRVELYRGGAAPVDVRGKTAIIVDDGIATGMTVLAAVESVRRRGAHRVIAAAPVAAPDAADRIAAIADEFVALEVPHGFSAVGQFYAEFAQTDDAEVVELLQAAKQRV